CDFTKSAMSSKTRPRPQRNLLTVLIGHVLPLLRLLVKPSRRMSNTDIQHVLTRLRHPLTWFRSETLNNETCLTHTITLFSVMSSTRSIGPAARSIFGT